MRILWALGFLAARGGELKLKSTLELNFRHKNMSTRDIVTTTT